MDFAGNGTSKPKQEAKCLLETTWKLPRKTADIWDELDVTPDSWNCYIIVYSSITTTVTPVTFKDLFHYPIVVSGHKHSSQANQTQPGRTKMQEKAKKKHFCCSFFSEGKEAVVISWNLAATKEQQLCFCHTETLPKQLLPQSWAENTRPASIFRDFDFHQDTRVFPMHWNTQIFSTISGINNRTGGDISKDQQQRVVLLPGSVPAQHRAKGKQNPPLPSHGMKQQLHE